LVEDTRQQRRIPLSTRAHVQKFGAVEKTEAELVDLSNYGASFKVSLPLKANDRIKISISVIDKDETVESEEIAASVRWVEHLAKEYLAGVKFDIKISDKGFPVFNHCLEFLKTHE
jgi:hypothetical protein